MLVKGNPEVAADQTTLQLTKNKFPVLSLKELGENDNLTS